MKNKKHIIGVISTLLLGSTSVFAQIGIGTNSPNKSAALEVEGQEKGVLIPRVQLTETTTASPVLNPANSLLVYNTASAGTGETKVFPGYYFWQSSTTSSGGKWVRMVDSDTQLTYSAGVGMSLDNNNNEFSRTGLEEIAGNNQKKGWRLIGVNPSNYGVIGDDAVDLSISSVSTNTLGATGYRAFAAGSNVEASGVNSIAIGGEAKAKGTRSLAFNAGVAQGDNSIAVGFENYAIGNYSIALGDRVQANKMNSVAIGAHLVADGEHETVFGLYNTPTTIPTGDSRRLFTVGNGNTTSFQSEAFTVLADGKVGVNITHFEQQVASGSVDANGNFGHLLDAQLQVNGLIQSRGILSTNGEEGSSVVVADEDGILRVRKTAEPGQFYMPSIVLPTNPANVSTSTDDPVHYDASSQRFTINLHNLYAEQFGSPVLKSDNNYSLVTYGANELAYFVTYTDSTVYTDLTLSDQGVLTYKVSSNANVTEKTYMNIVLKVK